MKRLRDIIGYGHVELKKMRPHFNPGMEFMMTGQGDLIWEVDGKPEHVPPGHLLFAMPWQQHGSNDFRQHKYKMYWFQFALDGTKTSPPVKITLDTPSMPRPKKITFPEVLKLTPAQTRRISNTFLKAHRHAWPASPLIKQLFPELIDRLEQNESANPDIIIQIWTLLLLEFEEIVRKGKIDEGWISPTVRKVQRLIAALDDIEHPWTLEEMEERCGIKRTHLNQIFRELTGFPPRHYLSLLRFNKASELLRNTDKPKTDIAIECGYNSSQYFTGAFKKITHMTPSQYRKIAPELGFSIQAPATAPWTAYWSGLDPSQ